MKNVANNEEFEKAIDGSLEPDERREAAKSWASAVADEADDYGDVQAEAVVEHAAQIKTANTSAFESASSRLKTEGPHTAKRHEDWRRAVRDRADEIRAEDEAAELGVEPFQRGDQAEIGLRLLQNLEPEAAPESVAVGGDLYVYEDGLWNELAENRLHTTVQDFAGTPVSEGSGGLRIGNRTAEGAIECALKRRKNPGFFQDAPHAVVFEDCTLLVDNGALETEEHSPEHRARTALNLDLEEAFDVYEEADAGGAGSRVLEFLDEIFEGDEDAEDKRRLLQEFVGAGLLGVAPEFQRSLILLGDGGNGKSMFAEAISSLFADDSVTSIPPQDLTNTHKAAQLHGARWNKVADLPETGILESGIVKKVITGESVTASEKYGPEFTFEPRAAHLFTANNLPPTRDLTHGFFRRFILVEFNRQFTGDEKDPNLLEALTTPDARRVWVAWAAEGLQRLLNRDEYSVPDSHNRQKRRWRIDSDSVAAFVDEECTETRPAEQDWTPIGTLYEAYKRFCDEVNREPVAKNEFGQRLSSLEFENKQKRIDGTPKRARPLWLKTDDVDSGSVPAVTGGR